METKRSKSVFSRLVALCLAFVFVFSMSMTALAADVPLSPDAKQSVTVGGLEPGVQVYLYRIVKVNIQDEQPASPVYLWEDGVKGWVTRQYSDYIGTDGEVTQEFQELNESASTAFWQTLAAAVKSGDPDLPAAYEEITGAGENSVTFSEVIPGEYIAIAKNTTGVKVYRPTTVSVLPSYDEKTDRWYLKDVTAPTMKSTEPSVTKTVDEKSVGAGDTVTYTITALIPEYPANVAHHEVIVADALETSKLAFNNDIAVKDQSGVPANITEDYTVEQNASIDGKQYTFAVTFTDDYIAAHAGQNVTVTYTAEVTREAVQVNDNTAVLIYNNDPYADAHQTKDSTVSVYSYGITFNKVNESDKALTDVQFELYKANAAHDGVDGNALKFTYENGAYKYDPKAGTGTTSTLDVDDSTGQIKISALDTGYYMLKETKASDSGQYVVPRSMILIFLSDDPADGTLDNTSDASISGNENVISIVGNQAAIKDNTLSFTVKNTPLDDSGLTLPVTGGMGTMIFTIAGILLMAGAVTMIVVIFRKKKA